MEKKDIGKYSNILNRPEFNRYFSYDECDAVCSLTDKSKYFDKEELLKLLRSFRFSQTVMPLIIAHKDFNEDAQNELVEQSWFTEEMALELSRREDLTHYNANTVLLQMNRNTLYGELWENRGKISPVSQILLKHIAAEYLTGNRRLFSNEFAVIFAHIKNENMIQKVLDNMDKFPWLDLETRERMNACIASNININEDLRMRAFSSDCDFNMVQAKTPIMNQIMYESLVETYAEIECNSMTSSAKDGAYNHLMFMLRNQQLSEDCEMDLYNRARSITDPNLRAKEMINEILSTTKNTALLQCSLANNNRELKSIANNPHITVAERCSYLLKVMEKIRPYYNSYKTVSKEHLSCVKEYLKHKPLPKNIETMLIELKDTKMSNIIASSYNTSPKANRMLQAQASQETCSVAMVSNVAKQLGLTEQQKDKLVDLLESVHKFNSVPIGRDDDCSLYIGPKGISDYDMLVYEQIFESLTRSSKPKIKHWGELCLETLKKRKEIETNNRHFDINKNTNAHLALMKYHMIINLNKTDDISMYRKIGKVSELCEKIDNEIQRRKNIERGDRDDNQRI